MDLIFLHRLFLIGVAVAAVLHLPIFNEARFADAYATTWPETGKKDLAVHFATWDSAHYYQIAENGYSAGSPTCAFYPLLPFLIHLGVLLTGFSPWIVGLLISNIASCWGLWLLHRFVSDKYDIGVADDTVLATIASPGAFILALVYTESVFLLLAAGTFLSLRRKSGAIAFFTAFCLSLTRSVGVLILIPLVAMMVSETSRKQAATASLGALAGFGTYLAVMQLHTGNAWEGFHAQKWYANQPTLWHWFEPANILHHLTNINSFHEMRSSLIDRLIFLVFFSTLFWLYKTERVLCLYAAALGLVPAIATFFISFSRFYVVCFPCALAIALFVRATPRLRPALMLACGLSFGIQSTLLVAHLNFYWGG